MACNSDYLNPTRREVELRRTAALYAYALRQLSQPVPEAVTDAALSIYCSVDFVPDLCALLTSLSKKDLKRVVYNAQDKTARDLADWWEEHQAADRKRLEAESQAAEKQKLMDAALAKLSPAEAEALGFKKNQG